MSFPKFHPFTSFTLPPSDIGNLKNYRIRIDSLRNAYEKKLILYADNG